MSLDTLLFLTVTFTMACNFARSKGSAANSASPTGNSSSHIAFTPSSDARKDSLTNIPHFVLFALGFILTAAQFHFSKWSSFVWSAGLIVFIGALVEILEGITGQGHCRVRDLIPDTVGALISWKVIRFQL